jgi:hypothetical protein
LVDSTKYGAGAHTIYLEAFDAAGNHADSTTISVTIPNAAGSGGSSATTATGSSPSTRNADLSSAQSTPVAVTGNLVIAPTAPGEQVSVAVDGKPTTSNVINTTKLTNGVHTITITEDGVTKTEKIKVHNSLPIALRNDVAVHRTAYLGASIFLVIIALVIWFTRRLVLLRLLRVYEYERLRFGRHTVAHPTRKR